MTQHGSGREFMSWVLIGLGAFPLAFGWVFLVSGIGVVWMAVGLGMIAMGVGLRWSWWRLAFGLGAVVAGCSPNLFLLAWIALGLGER